MRILFKVTESASGGVMWEKVPQACGFIKKETLVQLFPSKFCTFSKNTFFTEYLWASASEVITAG